MGLYPVYILDIICTLNREIYLRTINFMSCMASTSNLVYRQKNSRLKILQISPYIDCPYLYFGMCAENIHNKKICEWSQFAKYANIIGRENFPI